MLKGHLNYFAVSGNHPSLWWFFNKVKRLWLGSLKRRSQTARLSWERFIQFVARFFPPIVTIFLIYIGPFLNRSNISLLNSSIARASISSKVIGCSLMANAEAEEKDPRAPQGQIN